MSKSVFAGKATQRALAGLTSLALVAGGLTVVPSVAGAQEIKECNGSFVGPKNLGLEDSNLALKKNTYWPGESGTPQESLPDLEWECRDWCCLA